MTYVECIKNIQAKLPAGWRARLDVEVSIGTDVKAEWYAGLHRPNHNTDLSDFYPTMEESYNAIMRLLVTPEPTNLTAAAIEQIDEATNE